MAAIERRVIIVMQWENEVIDQPLRISTITSCNEDGVITERLLESDH
jgi:hypothetical protein